MEVICSRLTFSLTCSLPLVAPALLPFTSSLPPYKYIRIFFVTDEMATHFVFFQVTRPEFCPFGSRRGEWTRLFNESNTFSLFTILYFLTNNRNNNKKYSFLFLLLSILNYEIFISFNLFV